MVIIGLEGLLSADNALVMGVIVKDLPEKQQKKALFYGLAGAFVFRFLALFVISFVAGLWQLQAIGAIYLIYLGVKNLIPRKSGKTVEEEEKQSVSPESSLWKTIVKVELTDLAFAIDSILAAVAIAVSLPNSPLPEFGGMDGGKFAIIFTGMMAGLILIRVAATYLIKLMNKYPVLEKAAYVIVAWVGIKLAIFTLAHPKIGVIPEGFVHGALWNTIFWVVLLLIVAVSVLSSMRKKKREEI
ncbi:TerC family protein [Aciduricibacillus chroicocephali]|uniref:TerC family protein n=1 Tax=Aciduricibacillus chroicocephali TaxID=3054939 RepID=A0ABY9KZ77_9BACI|nr:TerC family protein [Bacillaceae bacterium 44XB]